MTILLILCLVATLLPTAALASEAAATKPTDINPEPSSVTAGVALESVMLTATVGSKFVTSPTSITINGTDVGVDSANVTVSSTSGNVANLTIEGCTPTKTGILTISVPADAFEDEKPDSGLTANINVTAPTGGSATASFSGGTLTAGQTASGTITVTVEGNGYVFNESLTNENFTLDVGSQGNADLTVTGTGSDKTANLTLSGTPTATGALTITVNKSAFKYEPDVDIFGVTVSNGTVNAPSGTVRVNGNLLNLTAGESADSKIVKLSASDTLKFKTGSITNGITLDGTGSEGLELSANGDDSSTVTLTLTGTPTKAGSLTVDVTADAFQISPSSITGGTGLSIGTVNAAGDVTISAEPSTMTAGHAVTSIKLNITSGNNEFTSSNPQDYTLTGVEGLTTISSVNPETTSANLVVSGTPVAGTLTVTAKKEAFKYQPDKDATVNITVSSPTTVSVVASAESLVAGKSGTINLSATDNTFVGELSKDMFTVTIGDAAQDVTLSGQGGSASTTLTFTPSQSGDVTVKINKTAFTYQPSNEDDITATGEVKVSAPSGTLKATVEGGLAKLYAGTAVNGEQIKLTLQDGTLKFKNDPGNDAFTLNNGLSVSGVSVDTAQNTVILSITGTPTAASDVTITAVKDKAFDYAPTDDPTATVNVNEAPTVTLSGTAITAGTTNEITITITEPTVAKFNTGNKDNFSVSGEGYANFKVEQVQITDVGIGKNVKLTLKAAPTTTGILTVTVNKDGFTPVAAEPAPHVDITVSAPTGNVTGELNGTLTAGKEATGTSITLTATDTLKFKTKPEATSFTLNGDGIIGTLKVDGVQHKGDQEIQLDLSGIPAAGGSFTVAVPKTVFVAEPADEPSAVSLTVGYPNIILAADPNLLSEDDDTVKSIKLKATDGFFNAVDETGSIKNFAFSGYGDLTLESVKADADSTEATLTFTGTPETEGTLTITVQPDAFKYKPENAVTAKVSIGKPTGEISATPGGSDLYNGTPVTDQTVTLDITESHGLHFKESGYAPATDFTLTGNYTGLTIEDVTYESPAKVTLTLGGTPSETGSFQVQANTSAFKMAPASAITATGDITISAAPTVTVSEVLSTPLYAGTSAAGATITLDITSSNTAFAAANPSNFSLTGTYADLSITKAALSGGKIVLTLSGTPAAKGNFQVQIKPEAFTIRPASNVNATPQLSIGGANVKLTVTDNTLQAGAEDKTFKLTVSGSTFAEAVKSGKVTITGQGGVTPTLSVGTVTVAEGVATVTVTGKPDVAGTLTFTVAKDAFDPAPDADVTVTVDVAKGAQTETTDSDTGSEEAAVFGTNVSDLAAAILGEEDKALFDKGAQVEFELNVDNETQVDEGDKTQVESVSTAGGYTVGEYLDVTLSYTVNGGSPVDVSTTKTPIKVVFPIPASIQAPGREYAVVRVHDGKAEIIAGPVTGTTITVSTDKFSTYAIIYRVAPAGSDSGTGTAGKTAPNTGDGADLALWTGVLALGLTGLAAVLAKRKKRSR